MNQDTMARITPMLALAALASCGARDQAGATRNGGAAVDHAVLAKLGLASEAFDNGQPIPRQYGCDGGDVTPELHWTDPPAGTKSFALVVDDPDAPGGTFHHWGVFNIPASVRSIGGGQRAGTEVDNDFGKPGYSGPCPPRGNRPHHYHFKLFALASDRLAISTTPKPADIETAARKSAIAEGELVGTYERR